MVKKIHVEIDIKGSASGFEKTGDASPKDREELRKVFSGEDFNL